MHPSPTSDTKLLHAANGTAFGVVLGADGKAEHEWGIDPMITMFARSHRPTTFSTLKIGRDSTDRLQLADVELTEDIWPEGKRCKKLKTQSLVLTSASGAIMDIAKSLWRFRDDTMLTAAWDQRNFAVRAFDDETKETLRLLFDGFATRDIALWYNRASWIAPGGLAIARYSMVPQELVDKYDASYHAAKKLQDAADATGIIERVRAAFPSPYKWMPTPHSLHPGNVLKSRTSDIPIETAHPVMFFLNPNGPDSRKFNSGWYTVEELDQWIAGTGPVIKIGEAA